MIDKVSISARNLNQRKGNGSLREGSWLTFFGVLELTGSFLMGRMAAEVALGQLLPLPSQTLMAEQIGGLMLLGLATLLVLVRLDHTCGICNAFQMALGWLQHGEVEEDG
jgi:hypothetical protein